MSLKKQRYPGAQPFEIAQQSIFFGRDKDIDVLCRKIKQEQLTVLHSKSGMGKSSLLNAGVIPRMTSEGEFRTFRVRFNAYDNNLQNEEKILPNEKTRQVIKGGKSTFETFLDRLIENEESLWHDLKEQQIIAHQKGDDFPQKILLIFDQFEELFTYPPEAILAFRKQLSEALYTPLPNRYWDMLELYGEDENPLSNEEQSLLQKPLPLRIVMAIRQDRVHLLGHLSDYLPSLSKSWYELRPLTLEQAAKAVSIPAALEGDFECPPFTFEKDALECILDFLTEGRSENIESTQLQIVCNSLEQKILNPEEPTSPPITTVDLGDLRKVIENYYLQKIELIEASKQQLAARRLIEEGLIYEEEERRLSLYEGVILSKYKLSPTTLRTLVNSHLLRAEPSIQGGYTYELSHDTLVPSVLQAKEKRFSDQRQKEEQEAERRKKIEMANLRKKAEDERRRAEKEKQLREKAQRSEKRAQQRTRMAIGISLLALGAAIIAVLFFLHAQESERKAKDALSTAEANEEIALRSVEVAEKAESRANESATLAAAREDEAKNYLSIAKLEKQEAQKARNETEYALLRATEANEKVVYFLLWDVDEFVKNLDFEYALKTANTASEFNLLKNEVANRLLEIAFWYNESGENLKAARTFNFITNFTATDSVSFSPLGLRSSKKDIETALRNFDPASFQSLQERYFPTLANIRGGTFLMGCDEKILSQSLGTDCRNDEPLHPVTLNDFNIGKTEVTIWQYALYRAAKGENIYTDLPKWLPTGDHPIVNVDWYGAIEYANWLSERFGLQTAYTIKKQEDPNNSNPVDSKKWTVTLNPQANGFRLPTEAEWEYAAKAGKNQIFSGSSSIDSLHLFANIQDNSGSKDGYLYTAPVKSYLPNQWGLYDMTGNVIEWCWDWYDENTPNISNTLNPTGPEAGSNRIYRGGSYSDQSTTLRNAYRLDNKADWKNDGVGFRLVKSAD